MASQLEAQVAEARKQLDGSRAMFLRQERRVMALTGAMEFLIPVLEDFGGRDRKNLQTAIDKLNALLPQGEESAQYEATASAEQVASSQRKKRTVATTVSKRRLKQLRPPGQYLRVVEALFSGHLPDTLEEFLKQVYGENWAEMPWSVVGSTTGTIPLGEEIAKEGSMFRRVLRDFVDRLYEHGAGKTPEGFKSSDTTVRLWNAAKHRSQRTINRYLKKWGI